MGNVLILFCEEIREIQSASDVANGNVLELDLFADSVFSDLDVTKAFGGEGVSPGDTSGIVVVDDSGAWHEVVMKVHFFEDVVEMLKEFDALVGGVDFSLGGATGGDGLSTRGPVDGAVDPEEETGDGAGFEEVEWRVVGARLGLVLGTPVGVGERCEGVGRDGKFDEGAEDVVTATVEGDTKVFGALEVTDDVFGGVEVTFGGAMTVLSE